MTAPGPVPGHVEPGGPPIAWDLGALRILKASVSAQDNNSYVLISGDEQLLVDAADGAARLLELLTGGGAHLRTTAVVTTHQHWDHHRALAAVVDATGARVLAGAPDAPALPVPVDVELHHGDTLRLGEITLDVIALRGHTPGSVALAWTEPGGRAHLFTGDSLFPGGVGKTGSPEDFASLLGDVEERLFGAYGDDAVVYPGHGDNTTLGAERGALGEWRRRGW